MALGGLSTNKSWTESLRDLQEEFRKWGIEDYILPIFAESKQAQKVTVRVAFNRQWTDLECSKFAWQTDAAQRNLRAIVLAIEAARKADQRGIGALLAKVTQHLLLPSGEKNPYDVLGVPRNTTDRSVLMDAFRKQQRTTHPDIEGGATADFQAVQKAATELGLD